MDLTIYLIQIFCGQNIAQLCERHCLMGTRRDYQRLTVDTIERKQHQDTRILAIQDWVETHYAEPISTNELTARFGFSTRNLTRRFKASTGVSLQVYIQEYRLEIAKTLLEDSSLSIQEICFKVGYESLTVFGRRFKAYTGYSSSQYRNSRHKNTV
jgi:transcriptional regulator GlxA family with amidase domain